MAALEEASLGRAKQARPFALEAAKSCLVFGKGGCGETFALLGELALADGVADEDLDLTLAWLALVPYEDLSMRQCEDATVLRYRVAEKRSPRRAESSWADRCRGAGKGGELGYRAAKADLIRGDTERARARLEELRARGSGYVVRAHYLFAVAELIEGRTESARDGFAAIQALPPARERTEGEDDARILAGLQLARVERDLGRYDAALAAYQSVPSLSLPRKDALLEGAVVAAHTGDLGAARNYLGALPRYAPDLARSIEMKRVRVQLAMLDDDEETALASFKELSALGRELETTLLAGDVRARLRADPSLGGLLDEREASRLVALGGEIERLAPLFASATKEAEAARAKIEREGPSGPVKEALDDVREADLLLRRAEGLIGMTAKTGVRIAGPEREAMKTASRAWGVRRRVDAVKAALEQRLLGEKRALLAELDRVVVELDAARRAYDALVQEAAGIVREGEDRLIARAEAAVHRLVMSEEIGPAELVWQRKVRATQMGDQLRRDHFEAMATLKSDAQE